MVEISEEINEIEGGHEDLLKAMTMALNGEISDEELSEYLSKNAKRIGKERRDGECVFGDEELNERVSEFIQEEIGSTPKSKRSPGT